MDCKLSFKEAQKLGILCEQFCSFPKREDCSARKHSHYTTYCMDAYDKYLKEVESSE